MSNVIIEYNGKYYSDTDLSLKIGDLYGGDLYDIYWNERSVNGGNMQESTIYYVEGYEETYSEAEEMVEDVFSDYIVTFDEVLEQLKEKNE